MKTPSPVAHVLNAYAEDMSVSIEGRTTTHGSNWLRTTVQHAVNYQDTMEFRIAAKRVFIGGLSFPAPMQVAPEDSTVVWYPECAAVSAIAFFACNAWCVTLLKAGFVQATKQGAVEQRDAIVAALGGTL